MIKSSIKEVSMVVENLNVTKDYENFAENYLGIDLEDYVDFIWDSELEKEIITNTTKN